MSIDNHTWVPTGARNDQNDGDPKYKSGDHSPSASAITQNRPVIIT